MRTATKILLAIIFSLLSVPAAYSQKSLAKADFSKLENRIINKIIALPEVQARIKYVDSASEGTRHLAFSFSEKPSKQRKYYWVQVMENNGISYYIHFNFRVDPKTLEIEYLDTLHDNALIDMKAWRKRKDK